MVRRLLIVCDDAGYASVDRGILSLAERTRVPLCADYLIEVDGAVDRAKVMARVPNVSIGLHFELSSIGDADRVHLCNELSVHGLALGEQPEIRAQAIPDARRQLACFRDALGCDPAHISTHGNFNAAHGQVLPWWHELMAELFGDAVPPMQLEIPHVRHNLYTWNLPDTARAPCTPEEFAAVLAEHDDETVEFVLHPALPQPGDPSLDMLFTAEMRIADYEAAAAIIESGVIERSEFAISAV